MAPVQRAAEGSLLASTEKVIPPVLPPEEALQRSINEYTEFYVKLGELRKQNEKQVEPLKLQNLEAQRLRQISQEMYKEQQQYSSKIKKSFDDAMATSANPPDVFTARGDITTAQAARGWWDHDAALVRMFFGKHTFALQRHKLLAAGKSKNAANVSNRVKRQRVLKADSEDELPDNADVLNGQLFSENEEDAEGGADDTARDSSKSKKHDDADDAGETNAADKDTRADKNVGDAGSDDGADDDENGSLGSDLDDLDADENGIDVNDAFDMEEGAMDFEDEG